MTNVVSFPGLGLEFELNRVFSVFGHEVSVFGRDIYWYGIIIAAGFLLAVAYGLWRAPRFSMDPDIIVDAILVVVPSAIVGARLYYVIFYPEVCFNPDGSFSLLRAVAFWDGGLAIYGGVIATVVAAIIIAKVRKASFWSGMDITVYGLLIGQAIGRWGNFFNVEAYGSVTSLPWRMWSESIVTELQKNRHITITAEELQAINAKTLGVHPTFLYESLWNLLGFLLLVLLAKKGRKFNGQMFLSYVVWYGLGRAAIEGLRTDSLYFFGTGIRTSQMLGVVSAAVGIALYVYRLKTAGPADPPFVREESGAEPAEPGEAVPDTAVGDAPEGQGEDAPETPDGDTPETPNEGAPEKQDEDVPEIPDGDAPDAAAEAEPEEKTKEMNGDGGSNP